MELFKTQIGNVLEQLKVALLSHIPIAYLPTNDLDFINALLFSKETHGALIPRLWLNGDKFECLGPDKYFTTVSSLETETHISDNYHITPSFPRGLRSVPSLWVINIDNWKDAGKALKEYLRLYLDIKDDQTYNRPETVDNVRRSLCIVVTPKRTPVPDEYAPYVKRIEIPAMSDEEIRDTVATLLEGLGLEASIFSDSFLNQLVVSLRGFSKTKIRRLFYEIGARQFILPGNINEDEIMSAIRADKKAIMEDTPGLKWESTGNSMATGLQSIENWIESRTDIFSDPEKATEKNIDIPNGLLISGIPGSGKSLMAKTTAAKLNLPLISLDMGDLLGGIVGQSEHNMINALHIAERMAPCVLWIDEIEKAFSGSSQSSTGDSGVGRRMFGKFLTWMQEKSSACFVFATSNDISMLPPELFRSERFDRKFFTFMPTVKECADIFSGIIKKENKAYHKRISCLPPSKAAMKPFVLFDKEVENPDFWVGILNNCCAPADVSLTLIKKETNESETDNRAKVKYEWDNDVKPNFKLLTGADIAALIKEIKFNLYKYPNTGDSRSSYVYSSMLINHVASGILRSSDFKPYGETNVLDIVRCFYRLYINQFVPASGQCVLDFNKYSDDGNYYRHSPGDEPAQRYDNALYYLLVGAINYYGSKIKFKP